MAKAIFNRPYIEGATELGKRLMIKHIMECLGVEGYQNGGKKALKMDKTQAAYLRGIYEALELLSNMWITLKKGGSEGFLITNLLSDEFCADYIVDRYAYLQKLFPTTYKEAYEQAERNNDLVEVSIF